VLRLPEGGFARGTRGAVAFAEEAAAAALRGADELALAEPPGYDRRTFLAALERTAAAVRIPVVALARLAEVDELRALVEAGADRVDPGPGVVATPSLLEACAARIGSPRLIAELPVRRDPGGARVERRTPAWARDLAALHLAPGGFEVVAPSGVGTGLSALAWAGVAARRGAGELLVIGAAEPIDPALIRALGSATRLPAAVRSTGEAAEVRLLLEAGADAVLLPAGDETPLPSRRALAALADPS
jgi:cyclase